MLEILCKRAVVETAARQPILEKNRKLVHRSAPLPAITSIAKTLGAPSVSPQTLALAQEQLESVTVVSDEEAVQALQFILERLKILTEPAASCTLAAASRLKNQFDQDNNVVLILCGGNLSLNDLCRYI